MVQSATNGRFEVAVRTASRRAGRTVSLAAAILLAFVTSARGAGIVLYPTDAGTASAGQAAMAEDASTAASNPAGMTLLDRSQLMTTPGALLALDQFRRRPGNDLLRAEAVAMPACFSRSGRSSMSASSPRTSSARRGCLFGLRSCNVQTTAKHGSDATIVTGQSLITGKVNPSLAYDVNEWLSVGAGFSFGVGRLTVSIEDEQRSFRACRTAACRSSRGMKRSARKVGILLRPISKLRVGLTYQSPDDYKFGFRPHLTGLGPLLNRVRNRIGGTKINIPLTEPQQVMVSAALRRPAQLESDGQRRMAELVRSSESSRSESPAAKQRTVERQPAFLGYVSDRDRAATSDR